MKDLHPVYQLSVCPLLFFSRC
uniref:Uncharacterized protein n=1 Tax=Rhizophora mucronata TaxID=61149 RepID=A0A2P2IMV4_RHIMU